ncbi:hypothetical protein CNY89_30540, partial [Amaricoccus sp. HAR-UPW-R2A-40]
LGQRLLQVAPPAQEPGEVEPGGEIDRVEAQRVAQLDWASACSRSPRPRRSRAKSSRAARLTGSRRSAL